MDVLLTLFAQANATLPDGSTYETNLPTIAANYDTVTLVLQIVFGIIGALAVIMLMVAAVRLIGAQGEPGQVAKARNSIVYAVIGIAVALLAEAIVTFVLGSL